MLGVAENCDFLLLPVTGETRVSVAERKHGHGCWPLPQPAPLPWRSPAQVLPLAPASSLWKCHLCAAVRCCVHTRSGGGAGCI